MDDKKIYEISEMDWTEIVNCMKISGYPKSEMNPNVVERIKSLVGNYNLYRKDSFMSILEITGREKVVLLEDEWFYLFLFDGRGNFDRI